MPEDVKSFDHSATVAQLRHDLVAACRVLVSEGVSEGAFNVSCRIDDDTMMAIPVTSPTLVTENNLVIHPISEGSKNWKAHPAIYQERPDVGAIVHVHPPHVVAFSTVDRGFTPVHHYGAPFHDRITVFKSPGQTKSDDRAREMARQLGQGRAILQRGHGVIVVGKDLKEATILTLFLEESCRITLLAEQMGSPAYLTPAQSEKITPQILKQRSQDKAWEHYLSKTRIRGYL